MRTERFKYYLCASVFIGGSLFVAGCEVTHDDESDARKKQRSALNDPYHYGPNAQDLQMPEDDVDPTDITGGGTSNLNKKLLKRDLDKVFGTD